MRKIILIPAKFKAKRRERGHERHMLLFEMLSERLSFDLRYTSGVSVDRDTEMVISYGWEFVSQSAIKALTNLPQSMALVVYSYDTHWVKTVSAFNALLERSNLILDATDKQFKTIWPQYVHKYAFLPNFFAPTERYVRYKLNPKPIMKCLLSGQTRSWYPLAVKIAEKVSRSEDWKKMIAILGHPRFPGRYYTISPQPYKDYSIWLHKFFCCIVPASKYPSVTAKCLEIPATGSLLLTEAVGDLEKMGFVPWTHYVPIDWQNIRAIIKDCLSNPRKYYDIRKTAMDFVRKNHSIDNRFRMFEKLIKEIA